jgi:altronate dehydratase
MPVSAIVLAGGDNVGVVTDDVRPGSEVDAVNTAIPVRDPIPFGHKIALMPIEAGDTIVKFGVPIGRAKQRITPGEHVHVHNIESAYINNAVDHYES